MTGVMAKLRVELTLTKLHKIFGKESLREITLAHKIVTRK